MEEKYCVILRREVRNYWVGKEVCLGFSTTFFGKKQMKFLVNPIESYQSTKEHVEFIKEKCMTRD